MVIPPVIKSQQKNEFTVKTPIVTLDWYYVSILIAILVFFSLSFKIKHELSVGERTLAPSKANKNL